MISITPTNNKKQIPFANTDNKSSALINNANSIPSAAKSLEQQGNNFVKHNQYEEGIDCYKKALAKNSKNASVHYSLAKAYKHQEDYANAIPSFEEYIKLKPKDVEAKVLIGECYHQEGLYARAKEYYKTAIAMDPSNDLPKRNLLELENNLIGCYDPRKAMVEKQKQANANLNTAIKMATKYLPNSYLKDLSDITVTFDKTAKMGGTANIAQYENSKRKVTVTEHYTYASPQLVGAYLVHEFIHAKDKDPYTSVHEEQDAYRESVKFWQEYANGIADPEMDYALELYNKSPKVLDERVSEIYQLRDPDIAMTSPNHPPSKKKAAAAQSMQNDISGQPIKNYDVIA